VARGLARGASPAALAKQRNVSIETVRTQLRAIYAKLGVRRQGELAARLRHLI
jgi:DNA-binding CsgD family transcriptional regulator